MDKLSASMRFVGSTMKLPRHRADGSISKPLHELVDFAAPFGEDAVKMTQFLVEAGSHVLGLTMKAPRSGIEAYKGLCRVENFSGGGSHEEGVAGDTSIRLFIVESDLVELRRFQVSAMEKQVTDFTIELTIGQATFQFEQENERLEAAEKEEAKNGGQNRLPLDGGGAAPKKRTRRDRGEQLPALQD